MELDASELDAHIRSHVEKDLFSGAVLVAVDGEPIFRKAYGLACKRHDVPNRVDTKFNLGSINKVFTRLAIAQLQEKGEVDTDEFISRYIPDYSSQVADKVTVRHLIDHTSGLGHYWNEKFRASIGNLRTVDDFIALFRDDPLAFEPGERNQYSNAGYVLLGKIIENVSDTDYYQYMRENVYEPAGMKDTDHYMLDAPVPNLATGYTRLYLGATEGSPRKENWYIIGTRGSPAGGGYSTLDDILRFDNALQGGGLPGSGILKSERQTIRSRPMIVKREGGEKKNVTTGKGDPRILTRAGGAAGIAALYERYLDHATTLIVLSNYDPHDIHARKIVSIHPKIREMILGQS